MQIKLEANFVFTGKWHLWEKRYFKKNWLRLYNDYCGITNPLYESINEEFGSRFDTDDQNAYHAFIKEKLAPHLSEYNYGPKADRYLLLAQDDEALPTYELRNGNGKAEVLFKEVK